MILKKDYIEKTKLFNSKSCSRMHWDSASKVAEPLKFGTACRFGMQCLRMGYCFRAKTWSSESKRHSCKQYNVLQCDLNCQSEASFEIVLILDIAVYLEPWTSVQKTWGLAPLLLLPAEYVTYKASVPFWYWCQLSFHAGVRRIYN